VARFSTWLFTIARNLALNEIGRSGHRREITGETPREAGCDGRQVFDELAARDRRDKLQAALRRLPPAERSIIGLAYLRELPLAELARMEGCSNEAIKVRLHRVKARLRTLLEIDDE
jgi:RNA polymerase sigma-70 factor (ECF subfamily)